MSGAGVAIAAMAEARRGRFDLSRREAEPVGRLADRGGVRTQACALQRIRP